MGGPKAEHLVKHPITVYTDADGKPRARCKQCGRDADPATMVAHARAARHWRYLGCEEHYGSRYYVWEHQLTGRRFAYPAENYRADTVGALA